MSEMPVDIADFSSLLRITDQELADLLVKHAKNGSAGEAKWYLEQIMLLKHISDPLSDGGKVTITLVGFNGESEPDQWDKDNSSGKDNLESDAVVFEDIKAPWEADD